MIHHSRALTAEDLQVTLAGIEKFEDRSGIGLFTLLREIPQQWTMSRLRLLLECLLAPTARDEYGAAGYMALDQVTNTYIVLQDALLTALYPADEARDVLQAAATESAESGTQTEPVDGNFPSGA